MSRHVIIDGNNLLHAMHAHAPMPHIGRETMVKVIERWARKGDDQVTLVFDGPVPRGGLSKQMSSNRITVRFAAPVTADDIIVQLIHRAGHPTSLSVVTGDTAIRHEAGLRRCRHVDVVAFVRELFSDSVATNRSESAPREKPAEVSPEETKAWLDEFGFDDNEASDSDEATTD